MTNSKNPEPHPLEGGPAPKFTLLNQNEEKVNLPEILGTEQMTLLFFYPKDATPGCTTEACNFRDRLERLQSLGVRVFGVSPDDAASHRNFIQKHELNFDLLVDEDHRLADALKIWKEKSFMGKKYMGVERSTFLYRKGHLLKAWQPVKVDGHVDQVLEVVQELKEPS